MSQIYNSEEPVHHNVYLEYPANSIRAEVIIILNEKKIYVISGEMILLLRI
jgi:hypothetical protein